MWYKDGVNGGYGVAVARELVELSVRVRLPVVTQDQKHSLVRVVFVSVF